MVVSHNSSDDILFLRTQHHCQYQGTSLTTAMTMLWFYTLTTAPTISYLLSQHHRWYHDLYSHTQHKSGDAIHVYPLSTSLMASWLFFHNITDYIMALLSQHHWLYHGSPLTTSLKTAWLSSHNRLLKSWLSFHFITPLIVSLHYSRNSNDVIMAIFSQHTDDIIALLSQQHSWFHGYSLLADDIMFLLSQQHWWYQSYLLTTHWYDIIALFSLHHWWYPRITLATALNCHHRYPLTITTSLNVPRGLFVTALQ